MSGSGNIPSAVLSQQLGDALDGRTVRAAVFTTYTFDPGFFELHILPLLFDQSFSHVDKVRRIQLEDALRGIGHAAVYYDRGALTQDGEPAQLDYRRIDIGRKDGCFHPKVILLLVDEHRDTREEDEDENPGRRMQSLIVAVMSANLTRAGWWENVECAHIEEIKDREWRDARKKRRMAPKRCSFLQDLKLLLRRLRTSASQGEDQLAAEAILDFLRKRPRQDKYERSTSGGRYHTRIFSGQGRQGLTDWMSDLRLYEGWNLEVISPYFDPHGAGPLKALAERFKPKDIRVHLPRDADGAAQVSEKTYKGVAKLADWSNLAGELTSRGRDLTSSRLPPRWVHAKVYRLWHRDGGDVILSGSLNLTQAAHSHGDAGNLEAAFFVDISDAGIPRRWWLSKIGDDPERFSDRAEDSRAGIQEPALDLSLRYDWSSRQVSYRLSGEAPGGFEILETSGRELFAVGQPRKGLWVALPDEIAGKIHEIMTSTSFFLVRYGDATWRILVQEENMGHRPSLLTQLTPEEILEYWSLLTPDQRAVFIGERLDELGREISPGDRPGAHGNTFFDRFAGVYHAFGCLQRHVVEAIEERREQEAEARLLGAKYDSLPVLLEKSLEKEDEDPIIRYITFLCARQMRKTLPRTHKKFFTERRKRLRNLDSMLERFPEVRATLPRDEIDGGGEFLDWYERAFLKPLGQGGAKR